MVVEHAFPLGKQETGVTHYEGRDYTGLMRHLILGLVVLGFVATHTERLRGKKPAGDRRAGVPLAQPALSPGLPPPPSRPRSATYKRGHSLSPTWEQTSGAVAQETAA
jgi:hypothetical protein